MLLSANTTYDMLVAARIADNRGHKREPVVGIGMNPGRSTLRPLTLALAALAASSFASLTLLGLAPEIQRSLGLTTFEIGALGSIIYLSAIPAAWASGLGTARLGLAAVVSASLALLVTGLVICAISTGSLTFFLGVLVLGGGYGAVNPPTNVLADTPATERRALTVSLKQAGIPLGGVLAGGAAAVAIHAGSWRLGLLAAIIACTVIGLAEGIALRRTAPGTRAGDRGGSFRRTSAALDGAGFLLGAVQTATLTYLTTYAVVARGLTPAAAAEAFAIVLAASVLARPAWGLIADRTGNRARILLAVCVLIVIGTAALTLLPGGVVWASLPVVGAACAGWNGVYLTLVMETVQSSQVARRTGRAQVFINAGAVCGPLIFGVIASRARSWSGAWLEVALWAAAAGALVLAADRGVAMQGAR
jgi:MFS family permease